MAPSPLAQEGRRADAVTLHWWAANLLQVFVQCSEQALSLPRPKHFTFHGGGGAIFSIGLLRALKWTEWVECIESMKFKQGMPSARSLLTPTDTAAHCQLNLCIVPYVNPREGCLTLKLGCSVCYLLLCKAECSLCGIIFTT